MANKPNTGSRGKAATATAAKAKVRANKPITKPRRAAKAPNQVQAATARSPFGPGLYLLCLLLGLNLLGLGYLGYESYQGTQRHTQLQRELHTEIAAAQENILRLETLELSRQTDLREVQDNFSALRQQMQQTANADQALERELENLSQASQFMQSSLAELRAEIKPQEVWRLQVSQLIYLAEQERLIGGRYNTINYLLLQANELITSLPTASQEPQLRQALLRDINQYENLYNFDLAPPYRQLRQLDNIISNQLEFKHQLGRQLDSEVEQHTNLAAISVPAQPPWQQSWQQLRTSIAPYLRITRNTKARPLSPGQQELLLATAQLMIVQAQNALLRGQEGIYQEILTNIRDNVLENFSAGTARQRAVELLDELNSLVILPEVLPRLSSYQLLFGSH